MLIYWSRQAIGDYLLNSSTILRGVISSLPLLEPNKASSLISELRIIGGGVVSDPSCILEEFHSFYKDLYCFRSAKLPEELEGHLDEISFCLVN